MQTAEVATRTKWRIDPSHSTIGFKVKHLMITNIAGIFKDFGATIYSDNIDFFKSEIDFWINPGSLSTGDENRDVHLKGLDFFDIQNYEQITLKGQLYETADNDGSYILEGKLIIKGITKIIKLDVEYEGMVRDIMGTERAGFTVNGKINRKEWNLTWNSVLDSGGVLVSEDVKICCEIQLIKQ